MPVQPLFRRFLGLWTIVSIACAWTTVRADEPGKLNVLFIVVDDLNNNVGCYGRPAVKTPNIDRLAAKGVRFDRGYCQYPLCNPSRTSFLSGLRPDTTRVFNNNTPPRTNIGDVVFLPEHFRANSYYTARVGKIAHVPFEDAVKWDVSENAKGRGGKKACDNDDAMEAEEEALAQGKKAAPQEGGGLKLTYVKTDKADADEPDGRTARRIVELLAEHRQKRPGQPFFLAAGFHKPHLPWVCPKVYFALYPPEDVALPNEPAGHLKSVPPIALTKTPGADKFTDAEKKQFIAAYEACTSFTDAQVGVLLDAMDKHKLWDSTVVVFIGDHGWHLSEHGLWRKMSLFEESARVPFIVCAPGKRHEAVSPRLVEMVDLYPTLVELTGLPAVKNLEGTSLVPLLSAPEQAWKKAAFTVVARGSTLGRSVRTERYRYTEWGAENVAQLYDHQNDPHEYVNLLNDPKAAGVLAEMRKLLTEGWKAAGPPTVTKTSASSRPIRNGASGAIGKSAGAARSITKS
jgi:uncharacterized sulfatase